MTAADWLALGLHMLSLSLIAVGGAIVVAPDLHRQIVDQQGWLSDAQFTSSIALAQAAPGPNVLFVALLGWNVGWQSGSFAAAVLGLTIAMVGMLLPSSLLTMALTRWAHRHRSDRGVRAFKQGMAPAVVGLMLATGWILASAQTGPNGIWPLGAVAAVTALTVWKTQLHLLWLLAAGALLGAAGIV